MNLVGKKISKRGHRACKYVIRDQASSKRSKEKLKKKYDDYTFLVAPVDHILKVYEQKGVFTKPASLPVRARKDLKKYCDFHEDNCHDSPECRSLKDQIEDLIKDGKLTE